MRRILLCLLVTMVCAGLLPAQAARVTLVDAGTPAATIVLGTQPTRAAQFAAYELQWHLQRITGATLPIAADDAPVTGVKLLVGDSTLTKGLGLSGADIKPQEYLVRITPEAIVLLGRDADDRGKVDYANFNSFPGYVTDQGSCYAVYAFLERACGVRWFWPGEIGLDIQARTTLAVETGEVRHTFAFTYRWPGGYNFAQDPAAPRTTPPASLANSDYLDRRETELYWHRMRRGGIPFAANHTFNAWNKYYDTHPDWYGIGYPKGTYAQPCMTNPEVVKQIVREARDYFDKGIKPEGAQADGDFYGVVPNDNGNWCKCKNCQAKLKKSSTGIFSNDSASDLFFDFVNAIAAEIRTSHPTKYIATLAYADYAFPSSKVNMEPNIAVMCCLHIRNWWAPKMEKVDLDFFNAWAKTKDRPIYLWLYDCFPQEIAQGNRFYCFPAFQAHTIDRQMKYFAAHGARGFFLNGYAWYLFQGNYRYQVRTGSAIGLAEQVDHYVMLKQAEDPSLNVDALLDEFFTRYYGAAAQPMREMYTQMEAVYTTPANYPPAVASGEAAAHQTEEMAWKYLGTEERMTRWAALMAQAKAAAPTGKEGERVRLFERGVWDYMVAGRNYYLLKQELAKKPIPGELWAPKLADAGGDPAKVDWAKAVAMDRFRTVVGEPTDRKLELRIAFDETHAYFRFQEQIDPTTLRAKYDVTSGDCWELLLARKKHGECLRLVVGADGDHIAFVTGAKERYSWDFGAKVISDTTAADRWTVQIAVPLAQLLPGGMKSGWIAYLNVLRVSADGEIFLWQPMPGGLREMTALGALWLE